MKKGHLWAERIQRAKTHYAPVFRDMEKCAAQLKAAGTVTDAEYEANFVSQLIHSMTGELFARDPKIDFTARERINYIVWDGTLESLSEAMQIVQQAQLAQQMQMQAGPLLQQAQLAGASGLDLAALQQQMFGQIPQIDPLQLQNAKAIVAEANEASAEKHLLHKAGKTLQLLIEHYLANNSPLFLQQMREFTATALIARVGVVRLGWKRKVAQEATLPSDIENFTPAEQIVYAGKMAMSAADSNYAAPDASEEAQRDIARIREDMQQQRVYVLEEGPQWTFPQPQDIILDPNTRNIRTLKGCRWIAQRHCMTRGQIAHAFGEDAVNGLEYAENRQVYDTYAADEVYEVYEVWCKESRRVYLVAGGSQELALKEYAPPATFKQFFPWFFYAPGLISEANGPYPESTVSFLLPMQAGINRVRQARQKHMWASRPGYVTFDGTLSDKDAHQIIERDGYSWLVLANIGGLEKPDIRELIQPLPALPFDERMYTTQEFRQDAMYAVGASAEDAGAFSSLTATQSNISAQQRQGNVSAKQLELDTFLTLLLRELAQLCQQNLPEEAVKAIVGKGAVWLSLEDPRNGQIVLGLEAGSTGTPNTAKWLNAMQQVWPMLQALPDINHKELIKKLAVMLGLPLHNFLAEGNESLAAQNPAGPGMPGAAGQVAGLPQ